MVRSVSNYPTDEGFINLGIVIMSVSRLMFLVYFPDKGGMLVKAGGLGSYDPQIIKPAADPKSCRHGTNKKNILFFNF